MFVMLNKKTKIFLLTLLLPLGLGPFVLVRAAANGSGEGLPDLINEFFSWGLWAGTLIVAGVLIYSGFLYLTAAGNTQRVSDAKEKFFYAGAGLLILLSSFLILNTVNPQLVSFPFTEPDIDQPEPDNGDSPDPITSTTTFQELPVGTLTEKILAKDIDCYREGEEYETMVDCQDGKEITPPENREEVFKGLCYDFDQDDTPGDFKDANPDTEEIEPMTEHDRMDCLIKLRKAIEPRMEKLQELTKETKNLADQCDCSNCEDDGHCQSGQECSSCNSPSGECKCVKDGTNQECFAEGSAECCLGKPRDEEGDPCGEDVRERLDTLRHDALKREYEDKELKEMSVDKFQELVDSNEEGFQGYRRREPDEDPKDDILVADQLRYLQINFLQPLKEDLQKDLNYLEDTEDFLEQECPYQSVISQANFQFLKEETGEDWDRKKFCEGGTSWSGSCSEQNKVEITEYCKEFNAKNCTTTDEGKLPCFQCDLDELEKGDCATSTVSEREIKTCKPSEYLPNNETGSSSCTTTDATCTLCKIEDENPGEQPEQMCERYDDDPSTFYCPDPDSKDVPESLAASLGEVTTDPEPDSRYPRELIPIGDAVDDSELFAQLILDELNKTDEDLTTSINAVFDIEKSDDKKSQPCVLHFLPEGCMCNDNPDDIWGITHCSKELQGTDCECCEPVYNDEGERTDCDGWWCRCGTCVCVNHDHPCPMEQPDKCNFKFHLGQITDARTNTSESFDKVTDLVEVENLEQDDPDRHEALTMLSQSRDKMQNCLMGFEDVAKEKMNFQGVIGCSLALDLVKLGQLKIEPGFPIPNYNNCYPPEFSVPDLPNVQNSCYPYSHKDLSDDAKEACLTDQDSDKCQQEVNNIGNNGGMNNFFCVEAKQQP